MLLLPLLICIIHRFEIARKVGRLIGRATPGGFVEEAASSAMGRGKLTRLRVRSSAATAPEEAEEEEQLPQYAERTHAACEAALRASRLDDLVRALRASRLRLEETVGEEEVAAVVEHSAAAADGVVEAAAAGGKCTRL
jgi:hypothetical protein